ncbi:acyl-CoA carboxylase subunit beta [Variovorax sp. PBL-E5]|uniref:acyl-CoA carboxylase subunit beta n=1 Tax=Variovorax sp. PBL-E5 TaxID=434014 RepID=UPI0013189FD6|nr:carboxyl transferase domain-containing protein [Variovorax sp. PBL-E5]VTU45532.1 Methylmalonyl-CoA carboxyltransferase 12S subunit [Variovorax sp. PBL-E5]
MNASKEWGQELAELEVRRGFAAQMGGPEAIAKWQAVGRLNARERVDALVDAGSFREMGALAGKGRYHADGTLDAVTPSTQVMGLAEIDRRSVVVISDDFTIRGGSSEAAVAEKWVYADRYAYEYRKPIVRMVDTAGGSVKLLKQTGHTKIPGYAFLPGAQLLGRSPVVGIAMGACAGLGAIRSAQAHFSIMLKGKSQVFAGGPPVVKQALGHDIDKESLGGYEVHRVSGVVHNAADTEAEAFALARRFLSYLPANVWEAPPRTPGDDPAERADAWLNDAIPRDRRKIFAPRKIVAALFDRESAFEMQPHFGASLLTFFARLNGIPVGVMINNPVVMGGALTRAASLKMERFVDLCDTFHLPIVNLVDQPGTMTGLEAERDGTMYATLRAGAAIEQSSVPWCAIVLRRCFGLAGAMLSPKFGPGGTALPHRFAWPSARWGSIPIEGGVAAAYRREIEASPDPIATRSGLEDEYHQLSSPFRTAERFGIVDVIEPASTRPLLCRWAEDARALTLHALGPRPRTMR